MINVGCGSSISVNALALEMCRIFKRPDLKPVYEPERAGDLKHSFASLERAGSVLGYPPLVDFAAGLQVTIDWYRKVL